MDPQSNQLSYHVSVSLHKISPARCCLCRRRFCRVSYLPFSPLASPSRSQTFQASQNLLLRPKSILSRQLGPRQRASWSCRPRDPSGSGAAGRRSSGSIERDFNCSLVSVTSHSMCLLHLNHVFRTNPCYTLPHSYDDS